MQNAEKIRDLLHRMEAEMQQLNLWSTTPPDPEAFASTQPFCIDTMTFESWLQWVFVPRVHALLDHGGELPFKSQIAPLAEMMFREMKSPTETLSALVEEFDRLCSENCDQNPTPPAP